MASDMELYQQLEALPNCLKYGARQLQVRINRNTNIVPLGTDSVTSSGAGVLRFRLPSASIINLSSLSVNFNATISGLTTGSTNFVNAIFPASYKYVRRVQFYLGGVPVAGSLCNNYNQAYHAFVKATGNPQYCHGKVGQSFPEITDFYDQYGNLTSPPTASSKTMYQVLDDFLLLAKANGASVNPDAMIDSSLWQDCEIELLFDNNSILSVYADNTSGTQTATAAMAGVSWSLANCRCNVDCISSIPPIYAAFLEMRASRSEPIRFVYQNLITQTALIQNTTRLQISSTCIDGLLIAGLANNFNTATAFLGNVSGSGSIDITNNPKFNFASGLSVTNTNDTAAYIGFQMAIQVGTQLFPTAPYQSAYLLADSTNHHFWHASIMSSSLLYQKTLATTNGTPGQQLIVQYPYVNTNFLQNQFIFVQSFSIEDGWSSANKVLSGVDTSSTNVDILVISSGLAANQQNFLMIGLLSSVLEYDTIAKRVRVIQ
jgi:hypothetical protein